MDQLHRRSVNIMYCKCIAIKVSQKNRPTFLLCNEDPPLKSCKALGTCYEDAVLHWGEKGSVSEFDETWILWSQGITEWAPAVLMNTTENQGEVPPAFAPVLLVSL